MVNIETTQSLALIMPCFLQPALLSTKKDSSKHSGVISLFNQHFVKTGILDKKMGKVLAESKGMREESDYKDFVVVSKDETERQIIDAEILSRG
ncbi:MAG: HEPN domain-containing protein [bacterium]